MQRAGQRPGEAWRRSGGQGRTHIFLIGVEKPEREVTGLRRCSKLAQRLSVAREQEPEKHQTLPSGRID